MKKNNAIPPQRSLQFLRWFCREDYLEEIEGDLLEVFEKQSENTPHKAKWKFTWSVIKYFRPEFIKSFKNSYQPDSYGMYKSYIKTGWRNLQRSKGYSFINIGGLAMGMAVAMLIGLWIYDELKFNTYHTNYKKIGRVLRNGTLNGETFTNASQPYDLGEELKTKYGNNFKQVIRAWQIDDHVVSTEEKNVSMKGEFMDPAGPEVFSLRMLKGSSSGLKDPHSILLSRSAAQAIFGDDEPMDKPLKIDSRMEVKVTGVYEDLPYSTHFQGVKFFASLDLLASVNGWIKYQGFTNNFLNIYVELDDNISMDATSAHIRDAILNNIRHDKDYVTINPQIFLHPMEKWHLWSEWKNGVNSGSIQMVWLFGIVGGFVLLLACINFMNLSTARSEKRAREVGIRKSIGSKRIQLVNQFFSESFLVVILAFVFALIGVSISLNWFNELASKQMQMPWANSFFWFSSLAFILFTGLLAGSYPALYLSSFNPVSVLKGSLRAGRAASIPRQIMVVVQFTVSVTLIIGTGIVYQQIEFAKDRPIGYDRNGLLMMRMSSPDLNGKSDVLRTELTNTGVVNEVAECSSPPTDIWNSNGGFDWNARNPSFIAEFATFTVTPEYGKALDWQFTAGRNFVRDKASDSLAFVINESTAKILGYDDPVGQTLQWQSWWTNGIKNFTIIGVIKDQVVASPYSPTMPSVYFLGGGRSWIAIRINPQVATNDALPKIEAVFKKIVPVAPFEYKFVDQEYALKFAAEESIGKLATVFAVLAILISCLGLFGLASFVAEQRTKEIGIRKVMGASVTSLWQMLSRDFVVLVIISCCMAIPLSHYAMSQWLQQYEYRTEISWLLFAVTCIVALLVTLLTVSFQAIKAALMNPVKSLRSE